MSPTTTNGSTQSPPSPLPPQGVHQSPQELAEQQQEDIPPLSNIAPSIFVPATVDFTQPPPALAPDPAQRQREALTQIDEHAAAVRRNIHHMLRQEVTRSRRVGTRPRPFYTALGRPVGRARGPGLTPAQEAATLPGEDEEAAVAQLLDRDQQQHHQPPPPRGGPWEVPPAVGLGAGDLVSAVAYEEREPPRRYAVGYFLNTVKNGLAQLEGHAASVERVKEQRRAEFREEWVRRNTLGGGRPADGSGGGGSNDGSSGGGSSNDGSSGGDVGGGGNATSNEGDRMDTS
ncbi:hypothetical protein F5X99DRAFT_426264 [Biscogniauxia marginata]|nr:hypothetical protein F5X99DRAFT_426264 [Biscogniauxia marginata]